MIEKWDYSTKYIKQQLQNFHPISEDIPNFKQSAILILLIPDETTFSILMTSRSKNLNHHRGEMSFPGGKFDPLKDLNLEQTALRETYEEIGILRQNISILGRMNDLPTITGYIIRPFIGILLKNGEKFKINHDEVADIVKIPMSFLLQLNIFNEYSLNQEGYAFSVLSFEYEDPNLHKKFNIWGASAHILADFLNIIYHHKVTSSNYKRPKISEIISLLENKKKKRNN